MAKNFTSIADALAALQTDVANEDTVIDGAVMLIQGIPALIQNAVNAALAAGADPSQLKAFGDLSDTLEAKASMLAAAVASAPSGNVQPGAGVSNPAPVTSAITGGSTSSGSDSSSSSAMSSDSPPA